MTYVDTSAMVKLYYPEPESDCVSAWVRKQSNALLYSQLHELELKNALDLKVFPERPPENGEAKHEIGIESLCRHLLARITFERQTPSPKKRCGKQKTTAGQMQLRPNGA